MTTGVARYTYKLPAAKALQLVGAAIVVTVVLGGVATSGKQHRSLWWLLLLACCGSTLLAAWTAWRQTREQTLELGESEALLPKASLSRELVTIPYRSIRQARTQVVGGREMLVIEAAQGKVSVSSGLFASPQLYAAFKQTLQQRMAASKATPARTAPAAAAAPPSPQQLEEATQKMRAFVAQLVDITDRPPSAQAKIGSQEIFVRLRDGMKNERGVHAESMLCALGSLAGYSCQASLRRQALDHGVPAPVTERSVLMTIEAGGSKYFFGDTLNKLVAENQHSIWGLAGGAAQQAGCKELPDVQKIFKHVSETVGGDTFGRLQIADNHRPRDTPINYVKLLWPVMHPIVKQHCPQAVDWPHAYGLAIQQLIAAAAKVIDPALALSIVMQSAIAMSKVDLPELVAGGF